MHLETTRHMGAQHNEYEQITPEIKGSMKLIVDSAFPGEFMYALTSGSIVFGGAIKKQSDMDLMVVLKKEFINKPQQEKEKQIREFVDGYLRLHKVHDFMPDITFPGEYITEDQAEDAITGRGYHTDTNNKLFLPKASEEYYLEDSERWYRAWLSMTAYGEYIAGDKVTFNRNKRRAWNTLILFNSADLKTTTNPGNVIDRLSAPANKWANSGISERYFTFREHELSYVQESLIDLSNHGFFTVKNDSFVPNTEQISQWHEETAKQIHQRTIRNAKFLVTLEEAKNISLYAEKKWKEMISK